MLIGYSGYLVRGERVPSMKQKSSPRHLFHSKMLVLFFVREGVFVSTTKSHPTYSDPNGVFKLFERFMGLFYYLHASPDEFLFLSWDLNPGHLRASSSIYALQHTGI